MKMFKSLLCIVLALMLTFSFTGCLHKQNEIAVEAGGIEFTAAMYSYALIEADNEAYEKVYEQLEEADIDPTVDQVDFYAQTIDGVDYFAWVENRAVEILSEYAAIELKFTEAGLTLTDAEKSDIEYSVEQAFADEHNSQWLAANGIGKETYKAMQTRYYYIQRYFEYLYGKGGKTAVTDEELAKAFSENYKPVFLHYADITDLKDDKLNEAKAEMDKIKNRIEKGEDIVKIFNELNGLDKLTDEQLAMGYAPAKKLSEVLQIFSNPDFDANYDQGVWEEVKDVKAKEIKVFEKEMGEGDQKQTLLILVYVSDINPVELYGYADDAKEEEVANQKSLDSSLRAALKSEEYEQLIKDYAKTLEIKKHSYAMGEFSAKGIVR